MLTNRFFYDIIVKRSTAIVFEGNGGIAQLARATGSYPVGHGFKSNSRYQTFIRRIFRRINDIRPVGQAAKTPPFHGGNRSSILLRVTKRNKSELFRKSKLVRIYFLLLNPQIDAVSERGHATSLFSFFSASCCAFHSANSLCPRSDSKYATISGRIQRAISIRR